MVIYSARLLACLLLLLLCFVGCGRRNPEAEKREALAAARARLRSCIPEAEPEGNVRLAISAIEQHGDSLKLRLIIYSMGAAGEAETDFYLPAYWMSRGRWLINERGRAYVLDADCREYPLKDRKESRGPSVATNGQVKLKPGGMIETTLEFQHLAAEAREAVLVYGARILPFSLVLDAPK
jgi:hypothetical protein